MVWYVVVVVVILFPTEYKQWRTEQMSNITTTINIDDPVGGHQRSQRLIGLATKKYVQWQSQYCDLHFSACICFLFFFMKPHFRTSIWHFIHSSIRFTDETHVDTMNTAEHAIIFTSGRVYIDNDILTKMDICVHVSSIVLIHCVYFTLFIVTLLCIQFVLALLMPCNVTKLENHWFG